MSDEQLRHDVEQELRWEPRVDARAIAVSARDGDVTAVATLAHGGRTIATYDIVISDPAGRRVCTSRLTCLIRDRVPADEANGTGLEREQGVTSR